MEFKGSQTEKNMKNALIGESLARNKYSFYAIQAKADGDEEVAEMFENMARNEMFHAKVWFQYLNGGLGDSKTNLKEAAGGEFGEWSSMYPSFAKQAREEGFDEIADMFERMAAIEKDHERSFNKQLVKLVTQENKASQPETAAVEQQVTEIRDGYRCQFCGAKFENRPDVCPVCKAIGSFTNCKIEVTK